MVDASTRLEDLTPGAVVHGIMPSAPVTVVQANWFGAHAVNLTYRTAAGWVDERILYRDDEPSLRVDARGRAWAFDADPALFRLVSEARRIRLAYLFDPLLAVHLSRLEPLPHQLTAVYSEMLPRQPLRFCLADDPGAGKTIMAGLYIKELLLRGDLARCLIVAPGGLVLQWQDELGEKFGMEFDLLSREMIDASRTGDPFTEHPLMIARLDQLSRSDELQERLAATDWDLVVVDEAHRMAAHWYGSEIEETRRYKLGKLLGGLCRHFLLMTATPHAGKEEDFQLFLALLDADRFEGKFRDGARAADTSDLMRRMIKEKLLRFDGRPLFPERRASTVAFPLSPAEQHLYEEVTGYVVEEMGRADRLSATGEGRRGNRVGFALTILQRRLASSPEAILQSLSRRRKRLTQELALVRASPGRRPTAPDELDLDDLDDLTAEEQETTEELLVDSASAAATAAELEAEIATLTRLERIAREVRASGSDRKWTEFSALLEEEPEMRHSDGSRRKLLVFTEHRDTLDYLCERLRDRIGRPEAVVTIHGGTPREQRRAITETFSQDKDTVVLVATDAAGEGLNLQAAHLVVNYDLPWNPNRIEQRFGRVHRIGQTEVCQLWNLVADGTREGQVYLRLLEKLEEQRKALGGQVFDVLGQAFEGQPLRELLLRAIREGDRPEVRARLNEVIDAHVGDGLADLVAAHGLAAEVMTPADVEAARIQLEEAEARRLQPHYVRAWTLAALQTLGGRSAEREPGRYELTHVPADVRARDRQIGRGDPVLARYHRVCFEPDLIRIPDRPPAELLAPGHPLLDSLVDLVTERYGTLLQQGAVLVDDNDTGAEPRALAYLEHTIADARPEPRAGGGQRVVSRRFDFVVLTPDGQATTTGSAPYLDLRPPTDAERDAIDRARLRDAAWLGANLGERAMEIAITRSVPDHLAQVRRRTDDRVRKTKAAVFARLTAEINHWDHRASELDLQAAAGRQPRMNPDRAHARADDLQSRLRSRIADLDAEASLRALPPIVVGGALIVPAGLLASLGVGDAPPMFAHHGAETDRRAIAAVLAAETTLGRTPTAMAHNNPGFDIRSLTGDGHALFLEVKGRIEGATTVTVTCNEVLHARNAPDRWILALVEARADGTTDVRYLRTPFGAGDADFLFAENSRNFDWRKLWNAASPPS